MPSASISRTLPLEKARAEVRRLWARKAWPVDEETLQDAWGLQDRFALSCWPEVAALTA